MITFLVDMLVLVRTMVHGLHKDPEFRAIAGLLVIVLSSGTLFYWQVEQWSIVNSLYFCVMTIATIGFGDFVPSGNLSRLFTIGFVVVGIGLFASFVGKLVALRIESHARAMERLDHHDRE